MPSAANPRSLSSDITEVDSQSAGLNSEALDRVRAFALADIARGRGYAAEILVARGGQVGYRTSIGEVAPGRPARHDDVYMTMSVAKSFTAALVLRAIDRGRLTLDTRVADVLPEFGARGKHRVTVRQLLTHQGGTWSAFFPPPPMTALAEVADLEAYVRTVSAQALAFTPGSTVAYNPFASMAVLGRMLVVDDEAGRSFRQIAAEDLFQVVGMSDTSFGRSHDDPRRVPLRDAGSDAAVVVKGTFENLDAALDETAEMPGGGAHSTADDLFRFAETLRLGGTRHGRRLLSRAITEYGRQVHTGDLRNTFWDFDREGREIPEYPANFSLLGGYVRGSGNYFSPFGTTASPSTFGSVGGGSTYWMVDPDRDLTAVFLSAGLLDGLDHFARLQRLSDLILAAVE